MNRNSQYAKAVSGEIETRTVMYSYTVANVATVVADGAVTLHTGTSCATMQRELDCALWHSPFRGGMVRSQEASFGAYSAPLFTAVW
jgi:hypothetical protein